MPSNPKVDKLYDDSARAVKDAAVLLEKGDGMTLAEREQCDKFIALSDECKAQAKRLQAVLDADVDEQKRLAAIAAQDDPTKKLATEFKSGAEFAIAVYNYREKGVGDQRLKYLQHKDLAGEIGISGGFLIPTAQQTQLLTVMGEMSLVRKFATVVPMASRVVQYPAIDYSQGAAGVDAFAGGIIVYRVEENAAITESQPKFKQINLHVHEYAAYSEVPNGLLRDSAISLEGYFGGNRGFGGAIASYTDYDAINGDGTGKLMGVLNVPAKLTVTRNAATNFKFVDAVTMLSKMLLSGKPRWLINQSVMPKLLQFSDAANFNIFIQNAALAVSPTLLGIPIDWTGKNPALGIAGDVMLVDWSLYLLGDRQQLTFDVDRSFKFQNNQTAFRAVIAQDGQPWLGSSITLMDGATTVSPYVVLS